MPRDWERGRGRTLTDWEEAFLRENWPDTDAKDLTGMLNRKGRGIAGFTPRTVEAVRQHAKRLRLRKSAEYLEALSMERGQRFDVLHCPFCGAWRRVDAVLAARKPRPLVEEYAQAVGRGAHMVSTGSDFSLAEAVRKHPRLVAVLARRAREFLSLLEEE